MADRFLYNNNYRLLVGQSPRLVFALTHAFTNTAGRYDLPATSVEQVNGAAVPLQSGQLIAIQPVGDDMYVRLVAAGATAGTTASNAVLVTKNSILLVYKMPSDGAIDVLAASATGGTVNVFYCE